MSRRTRLLAAATLAVALGTAGLAAGAWGGVSSASAHDFLVSTNPAADAVVTEALPEVSLTFNEPPLTELGAGIAIEVRDAAGANVASGEVSIVDSTLSIAVTPTATGSHTVIWQTVSSDGHPVSGEYAFDYEGPVAEAAPTPGPTPAETETAQPTPAPDVTMSPSAAPGSGAGEATPTSAAAEADGDGGAPLVLVGIGGAVVLLAVVATVLVLLLRRRPDGADETPGDQL